MSPLNKVEMAGTAGIWVQNFIIIPIRRFIDQKYFKFAFYVILNVSNILYIPLFDFVLSSCFTQSLDKHFLKMQDGWWCISYWNF